MGSKYQGGAAWITGNQQETSFKALMEMVEGVAARVVWGRRQASDVGLGQFYFEWFLFLFHFIFLSGF